jgi:hypothetical protein
MRFPGLFLLVALFGGLMPARAKKPAPMFLYDMRYVEELAKDPDRLVDAWDQVHAVSALQGIVNRDTPTLYLRAIRNPEGGNIPVDDWWLERLQTKGAWLEHRPTETIDGIDALVRKFRKSIHGVVVYDVNVPATSNIASTVAGVEDVLPVRYDMRRNSLFRNLTEDLGLPVKTWLIYPDGKPMFTGEGRIPGTNEPTTGSAKNDAYRWAIAKYLESGRCDTGALGFYIDAAWLKNPTASIFWNHTLTNHDYFIARKSFFFDLSPWDDEPATDDPGQKPGTDLETLKRILSVVTKRNDGKRMAHIGGFIPWAFKYTDLVGGKHEGVPTEWKFVEIISAYDAYLDADALGLCAMANASFFSHQELPKYPEEKARDLTPYLVDGKVARKQYVTFYVGDWDSAAWMYQMLPTLWEDPARGSVPMGWAFNPELAARFPAAFWYTRATRSDNDTFIAGDSGAGYVNPSLLAAPRPSGMPDAVALWERHNRHWFDKLGLGITGFVIDGYAPPMPATVLDAYARFSPDGTVAQKIPPLGLHNGMPLVRMNYDLGGSPEEAARTVLSRLESAESNFNIFRAVLKNPSWYAGVASTLQKEREDVVVLDPYTFMALAKRQLAEKR